MKIKRLVIENFKSIERIELVEPNPFTVFVGPNGSGKSNIFEALEFVNSFTRVYPSEAIRRFGGSTTVVSRKVGYIKSFFFEVEFDANTDKSFLEIQFDTNLGPDTPDITYQGLPGLGGNLSNIVPNNSDQFYRRFRRLFINNDRSKLPDYQDEDTLNFSASNLEKVLDRILSGELFKAEIFEWLKLFVPGFDYISIDNDKLLWFEKPFVDHFTKDLISDGTYNILALLTAVYQSDKPQFLCIEEPENGLNPKVIKELVNLCRYACEEYGHYIWLNTHSQTLVSQLTPDEIILVDKKDGATQTKQIKGMNLHALPMDEAWLSNALGGGLPW